MHKQEVENVILIFSILSRGFVVKRNKLTFVDSAISLSTHNINDIKSTIPNIIFFLQIKYNGKNRFTLKV